jgi:uncharacterized membrane protein YadS
MTFIKPAEWVNEGADARLPSISQRWERRTTREILPWLFLKWVIAGAAFAMRQLPGMATFSPMILSIGVGIAFDNIVRTVALAKQGVISSLRWLLRVAFFQLVLQLASGPDIGIGAGGLGIIAATVRVCFAFAIWIGRWSVFSSSPRSSARPERPSAAHQQLWPPI